MGAVLVAIGQQEQQIGDGHDAELRQARGNEVEFVLLVRIDIIARRTDERTAFGRIEFRNFLVKRIEVNVRHTWIKEAVEAFDEADNFNPELVAANDRALDGGVERRRIAAGGEVAQTCLRRGPEAAETAETGKGVAHCLRPGHVERQRTRATATGSDLMRDFVELTGIR